MGCSAWLTFILRHDRGSRQQGGGMVHYRVTASPWRRAAFPLTGMLAWALILDLIFSDPNGTRPGNLAPMAVLLAWVTVFAVRGWRGATLTATNTGVRFRGLVWTRSWRWQLIGGFAAETRPVRWTWLPIRVHRRVVGIRLRAGQTLWLHELSCRPGQDGPTWVDAAVVRLNELAHPHGSSPGQVAALP
jgi:hypothetical protein